MTKRLYVGNLSFDSTEASLTKVFEQDGRKVSSVSIVTDRDTGRSRGFAFVEMSQADAQRAMSELNGHTIDGRALRVNEANDKPKRASRW